MERSEVHALLTEIFEDEALLLGGIVALHPVDDALIWRLVRGMDALRQRALQRIEGTAQEPSSPRAPRSPFQPHPAIEELLRRIRQDESGEFSAGRSQDKDHFA